MGNDQAHGSDAVLSEGQLAGMSYDAVIGHVQANLSGDFARDGALIVAIGRACEGHPQALEIRRELGRMLHGIAPAEMIEQVDRMANEDVSALDEGLARAKALVSGGDVAGGRRAVEELLGPYGNDNGTFADDAVSEYRRFANPLEEALYVARDRPTRTVRRIPYDRVALYLLYGYILLEQREMAAAETALREALRLNPVSTVVMFELAEVLKMTGRLAAWASTRTPSRRKSVSPSAVALRSISSSAILSSAIVVSFRRRFLTSNDARMTRWPSSFTAPLLHH